MTQSISLKDLKNSKMLVMPEMKSHRCLILILSRCLSMGCHRLVAMLIRRGFLIFLKTLLHEREPFFPRCATNSTIPPAKSTDYKIDKTLGCLINRKSSTFENSKI